MMTIWLNCIWQLEINWSSTSLTRSLMQSFLLFQRQKQFGFSVLSADVLFVRMTDYVVEMYKQMINKMLVLWFCVKGDSQGMCDTFSVYIRALFTTKNKIIFRSLLVCRWQNASASNLNFFLFSSFSLAYELLSDFVFFSHCSLVATNHKLLDGAHKFNKARESPFHS